MRKVWKPVRALIAVLISVAGTNLAMHAAAAQTVTAIEYHQAAWNHYFVTTLPSEIANLDGGAFGGAWKRTGQSFNVSTRPAGTAQPTCRFFSASFSPRSSHFYTPFAGECTAIKANPAWQFESIAFYLELPDAGGNCAAGTLPLYRAYNGGDGGAPNHRYTMSATALDSMLATGWVAEGHGVTRAFACVPRDAAPGSADFRIEKVPYGTHMLSISHYPSADGSFQFDPAAMVALMRDAYALSPSLPATRARLRTSWKDLQ